MLPNAAARAIAFYLPQFHPIPENDAQWGKGFTEWTNVARAKPLFRGHHQPKLPADLGFYDLRVPEVRQAQADLARSAGIEGFCYWHYWFGNGRRVLERVFDEVLTSGEPDFPFCLGWANQSWTGRWHGLDERVMIKQHYPGDDDIRAHFHHLLPAFLDPRYMEVDGRKLFVLFQPDDHPDLGGFLRIWTELAQDNGFAGFYFVSAQRTTAEGFDRFLNPGALADIRKIERRRLASRLHRLLAKCRLAPRRVLRIDYASLIEQIDTQTPAAEEIPCLLPNWDNTPRSGHLGYAVTGATPELFARHARSRLATIADQPAEERLLFIKSWNEWAEGNYLEPDAQFGRGWLDALRGVLLPGHK